MDGLHPMPPLFTMYTLLKAQLNFVQNLTSRQTKSSVSKTNNYQIGNNMLCNRLASLNGKTPLSWLNVSLDSNKVRCKELCIKMIKIS